MSWLSDLVSKKNNSSSSSISSGDKTKKSLFISITFTEIRFLLVQDGGNPRKILSWKEIQTGPFEDLDPGMPVRDIFSVTTKILTQEKDFLTDVLDVSVSLPSDGIFFKTVEVPKMEDKDMQKAVFADIRTTLPIDFSQVLFAQNDLGEKHDKMKTFFCVLIQKTTFENMKNIFAKFNLNPYFEIEVFSLARIPERDENYKLVVDIGKTNTHLIFLQGQIVQEVVTLEEGSNKMLLEIQKKLNIPYKDIVFLKERHEELHNEARLGAKVLDEYVKDFNQKLSKNITMHILEFEKKFNTEIQNMLITGAEAPARLQKSIHEEFDAEIKVDFISEEFFDSFEAENFLEKDIKRYAQCFGLAKRVK